MTVRQLRPVDVGPAPLRVISGRDRPRPRTWMWIIYTVAVVVAFLSLFFFRGAVDESAFELLQVQRQIELELVRQHGLLLEKARLESPGEIVPIAEQMLGMVLPDDVIPVIAVRDAGGNPGSVDSASVGVRGDSAAAGASR